MWEEMEGHIKKIVVGVEKEREGGGEKRGWWDEEYKERKKEQEYKISRREYNELC